MLDQIMAKLTETEQEHLRRLVEVDELTGVYNRRFFNRRIEQEVHRATHSNTDVSLLLFDIDDFKKYQDNHKDGHVEGDRVLRQVAQFLEHHTHDYDIVARIGGEEYALICPDTNLKQGVVIAERLRGYVDTFSVVTVSVGVANYKDNASNVMELYQLADKALYQAKHNGKNRVEVYKGE